MTRTITRAGTVFLFAARIAAAQTEPVPQKTFYTARDGAIAGAFLVASAGLSLFDARIAKNFQDTSHIHVRVGKELDDIFTHINETTLTVGGLAVWGLARIARQPTIADGAFHVSESVAAASLTAQLIRGPLGRTRPRDAEHPFEDQYEFHFMKGFSHFQQRAFPSIHSGSGFAAASAIVEEVHERNPGATWFVAVPAYLFAATPGLSRMYMGQHWASDIFAGAFLGTFYGHRIVSYSHSHERTPVDRVFLGRNSTSIGWTFRF